MATASSLNGEDRPNDAEASYWTQLAQKHWSKPVKTRKVKQEVINTELWEVLKKEDFHIRSLLILESLRLLEKYLLLAGPGLNIKLIILAIYGLVILKSPQTIMSCSSL